MTKETEGRDNYKSLTHAQSEFKMGKKEDGIEEIFEILMIKNSPKLEWETRPQSQEAQRLPSIINTKRLLSISASNYRKSKVKNNLERNHREK